MISFSVFLIINQISALMPFRFNHTLLYHKDIHFDQLLTFESSDYDSELIIFQSNNTYRFDIKKGVRFVADVEILVKAKIRLDLRHRLCNMEKSRTFLKSCKKIHHHGLAFALENTLKTLAKYSKNGGYNIKNPRLTDISGCVQSKDYLKYLPECDSSFHLWTIVYSVKNIRNGSNFSSKIKYKHKYPLMGSVPHVEKKECDNLINKILDKIQEINAC